MSSLDLRILDDTDDSVNKVIGRYSDGKAVEILRRYLEPGGDLSIGEATKLIDDMLPSPDERDLHFQLGNFGCLTLEQAQQIPYDHPAQMRFARLLQRLQRSYKLNEICCTDEGSKIYASMHSFRTAVQEWYDRTFEFASHNCRIEDTKITKAGFESGTDEEAYWINIAAFIARLAALDILDGTLWAISTMKDALESEPSAKYYRSYISAAALWILCAGQWLCNEVLRPQEANPCGAGIWEIEGLYTGPTHGLERWEFWQKAFAAAVENEHATDECKKLALRAVNLMEGLARDGLIVSGPIGTDALSPYGRIFDYLGESPRLLKSVLVYLPSIGLHMRFGKYARSERNKKNAEILTLDGDYLIAHNLYDDCNHCAYYITCQINSASDIIINRT